MSWHVLKLDLNSARWMPKLVSIDAQSYPALKSPLVHCKTIDPFSTTSSESQESYLTTGMLPYKHSSFFSPTHGSIMLPPRQPRVFARLARWQLSWYHLNIQNWIKLPSIKEIPEDYCNFSALLFMLDKSFSNMKFKPSWFVYFKSLKWFNSSYYVTESYLNVWSFPWVMHSINSPLG